MCEGDDLTTTRYRQGRSEMGNYQTERAMRWHARARRTFPFRPSVSAGTRWPARPLLCACVSLASLIISHAGGGCRWTRA